MKMKTTKKLAALLIGMPLASAGIFAGELSSYTSEVKINDYDAGKQKTEWTLGKGSYKLNDNFKFLFDVDKDFIESADGTTKQGWDTQFGFSQKLAQVAGFDLSVYYLTRYDASWSADDGSGEKAIFQYIVSPVFSKDITIADKDFSLTIETWAQVGNTDGGSLQDKNGFETSFYLNGSLSDNWELELAWYNFDYYDSVEDEYDYQLGTEDYLTYSMPLAENVTFSVEGYLEAYYTPDGEVLNVYSHVAPEVKYSKKVSDDFSWHAAVSYDVLKYEYAKTEGTSGTVNRDNNEMEITVGFKF